MDFTQYAVGLIDEAKKKDIPGEIKTFDLNRFFGFMSGVPFKEQFLENFSRESGDIINNGGDCGEKLRIGIRYFYENNIPFYIIFQNVKEGLYHICSGLHINGSCVPYDFTDSRLLIGQLYDKPIVKIFKVEV